MITKVPVTSIPIDAPPGPASAMYPLAVSWMELAVSAIRLTWISTVVGVFSVIPPVALLTIDASDGFAVRPLPPGEHA